MMPKLAILDDYQGVALSFGPWSSLPAGVEIPVFRDHLHEEGEVAARLADFDAVFCMRERTAKPTTAPPTTSAAIAAITVTSTWILLTFVRTAPGGAVE